VDAEHPARRATEHEKRSREGDMGRECMDAFSFDGMGQSVIDAQAFLQGVCLSALGEFPAFRNEMLRRDPSDRGVMTRASGPPSTESSAANLGGAGAQWETRNPTSSGLS
jgi:hypothetical protein